MLKQPDRIVIYPQRESNPDYLYCWIPPKYFGFVSGGNKKTESELEDYYPMGIEAEFSQEGFDEHDLSLPAHYEIKALHEAYGELHKTGMLKEKSFIDLKRLQKYVAKQDENEIQNLVQSYSKDEISSEKLMEEDIFDKLLEETRTTGKEEPEDAFQRLSGSLGDDE